MKYTQSTFIITLAIFSASVNTAARAEIGSTAFCAQYGYETVDAYNENLRLKCGYADNRWNGDFAGHYNWCLTVDTSLAASENKARSDILANCKSEAAPKIDNFKILAPKIDNFKILKTPMTKIPAPIKPNQPAPPPAQKNQQTGGFKLDVHFGNGGGNAPAQARKKFSRPMYQGERLDYCMDGNTGCGQDAADAFCEDKGFDDAVKFKKARGKGVGFDTIQIGTGDANENEPASAFKSITCE